MRTLWITVMAIMGAQPGAATWLAWGNAPDWRIEAVRDRWRLHVSGEPDVMLVRGRWEDTPHGRRMIATGGSGRFVFLATFGSCRPRMDDRRHDSSYFASLTLPDGRILRGCTTEGAAGSYPG